MAGTLASLAAGLMTLVGALPVLVMRRPSDLQQNLMLGFAAGVMLAASFFSLIIPALSIVEAGGASKASASTVVVIAVLFGAFTLAQINARVPSFEALGFTGPGTADGSARRVWLFVGAITLHNFPEGMAVGVSFAGPDMSAGIKTAIGIGVQNVPEGLAVAAALATLGYSRLWSISAALASGLVEPVMGFLGAAVVSIATPLLPWALGFAAGAMIFIVVSEVVPDAYARAGGKRASAGFMIGLCGMMFLDTALA